MLREWLQLSPNPTWYELVYALRRSPSIECPDIAAEVAAEIEDKYIKSYDSSEDTAGEWY